MTRKRYLAVAGLLAILVGAGFGLGMILMPPDEPGITKANFDRIEKGMTRAEIIAILGKCQYRMGSDKKGAYLWTNSKEIIVTGVYFTEDSANDMFWNPPEETNFEKLCRWLRL